MTRRCSDPTTTRNPYALRDWAQEQGCTGRPGKGDHYIVIAENGQSCVIPMAHRELATGTWHSILRAFRRMNLPVPVVLVLLLGLVAAVAGMVTL